MSRTISRYLFIHLFNRKPNIETLLCTSSIIWKGPNSSKKYPFIFRLELSRKQKVWQSGRIFPCNSQQILNRVYTKFGPYMLFFFFLNGKIWTLWNYLKSCLSEYIEHLGYPLGQLSPLLGWHTQEVPKNLLELNGAYQSNPFIFWSNPVNLETLSVIGG